MKLNMSSKFIITFFVIAIIIAFVTNKQIKNNNKIQNSKEKLLSNYILSQNKLNDLLNDIEFSEILLQNWIITKKSNTISKNKLIKIYTNINDHNKTLNKYSLDWSEEEDILFKRISKRTTDSLLKYHTLITGKLNNEKKYTQYKSDISYYKQLIADGGIINLLTNRTVNDIKLLRNKFKTDISKTNSEIDRAIRSNINTSIISAIIYILLILLSLIYISYLTIIPIKKINFVLKLLNKGEIPDENLKEGVDEIGEISQALNNLLENQNKIAQFSKEIGKKNFKAEYEIVGENDTLGKALLDMKKNLIDADEEALARKKEDDERNFVSQGIAKFGDILRQNNDNLNDLTKSVIINLVKYLNANQGGVYVINNDDINNKYIELLASYAYDKLKHDNKKIDMGIGLIGRSIQEKETIYLSDIPKNYINIKSGLGEENPSFLLIVPLKVNDEVFGAIEIASFKEISKFQIEFVESVCNNIASTLESVKVNINTNNLLEKTQQQAAEMREQEEEMRQNMEELQATQEESARREKELEKKVKEFEKYKKNQENLLNKLGKGKLSGGFFS